MTAESIAAHKDKPAATPANSAAPGNLAIIDLKAYEVGTAGVDRRFLLRALIENQTPVEFGQPWTLEFKRVKGKDPLGRCGGQNLPQGRVAVCEVWAAAESLKEEDVIDAQLVRVGALAAWDRDSSDDQRQTTLRLTPERGHLLRIAEWKLFPTVLSGSNEVQFNFTVEGSHLVWVISPGSPARLLAGHPADGVLTGKGKERVKVSGPVTLVARNSLGAFVYRAVPVIHPYAAVKKDWEEPASAAAAPAGATAVILDAGVYEVDEDKAVLDYLASYLGTKDWALDIERLRRQVEGEADPLPASVLNPKAQPRRD